MMPDDINGRQRSMRPMWRPMARTARTPSLNRGPVGRPPERMPGGVYPFAPPAPGGVSTRMGFDRQPMPMMDKAPALPDGPPELSKDMAGMGGPMPPEAAPAEIYPYDPKLMRRGPGGPMTPPILV